MLLVYILRPMLATLVYMKINNGNHGFMAIKQPKKKILSTWPRNISLTITKEKWLSLATNSMLRKMIFSYMIYDRKYRRKSNYN